MKPIGKKEISRRVIAKSSADGLTGLEMSKNAKRKFKIPPIDLSFLLCRIKIGLRGDRLGS
jgi:hypothetical protein